MAFLQLQHVSVEFPLYEVNSRSLKSQILRLGSGGKVHATENNIVMVKAISDLSCTIQKGDRVGLIGHNGAGKSTLLRAMAHIYEPTSGRVLSEGSIATLLDVKLGMDPESTGYENIRFRGIIHGLTSREIAKKTEEIAAFTELGDFLAMPIRTYSKGMTLRLAFAISTCIQPDILLIDEVVGTGDSTFMAKASARMNALIENSNIVVLASHANEVLRKFCNKVLWLESGQIKFFGDLETGLSAYETAIHLEEAQD